MKKRYPEYTEQEMTRTEKGIFSKYFNGKNCWEDFWDHVQDKTKKILARPNRITLPEYKEMRGNSWDWKVIAPKMTNEALIYAVEHNLKNCLSIKTTGRYSTDLIYEESLVNKLVPILMDRLEEMEEEIKNVINEIAEEIDSPQNRYKTNMGKKGCLRRIKKILEK